MELVTTPSTSTDADRPFSMDVVGLRRRVRMTAPGSPVWVGLDNEAQRLRCPCLGSRFDDQGQVIEAPAMQALREYPGDAVGTKLRLSVQS